MKKRSRKDLIKVIDEARRTYIRNRDLEHNGMAKCISCNSYSDNLQVGHYYSRRSDFTTELGGDERNVNLQCVPCNSHKRGNPRGYVVGLIRKYGKNSVIELEQKRKEKYWKIKDLENLLKYYETQNKKLTQ